MYTTGLDKISIKTLLLIAISLSVLNIINLYLGEPSWQITRLIDVDHESNIPTWFSSIILAIAALYAYECSILIASRKNEKKLWQLMSIVLLGMSCDEVAMIHEHFAVVINKYIIRSSAIRNSESFSFILGPIALLFIFWFAYRMNQCLAKSIKAKRFVFIGIAIYLLGALGLEATASYFRYNSLELLLRAEYVLEELCEMTGVIIIIKGLKEQYGYLTTKEQ